MPQLAEYLSPDRLIAEQLRRAPSFAALPADHRDSLALLREGAFFKVPAGIEIVSPGEPPALFVVTEGTLTDEDGEHAWAAGSCLGVAETLPGQPFATAIRTAAPSLLYRLDAALLAEFRASCPLIARQLFEDVAGTARAAAEQAWEGRA